MNKEDTRHNHNMSYEKAVKNKKPARITKQTAFLVPHHRRTRVVTLRIGDKVDYLLSDDNYVLIQSDKTYFHPVKIHVDNVEFEEEYYEEKN